MNRTLSLTRRTSRPAATPLAAVLLFALLAAGCAKPQVERSDEHGADAGAEEHVERGPNGGRLFMDDGVRLELRIHDGGAAPEFRAWLSDAQGKPLPTEGAKLSVALDRFAGRRDSLEFRALHEYLQSTSAVEEPHSFVVRIHLELQGRRHDWSYEQEEGRVRLSPEAVREGDIVTAIAGARAIEVRLEAPGEIRLNPDRVVQVRPRFPGVVRSLVHQLGDRVTTGDVLAIVHSDGSLSEYEVVSPMAGTIVSREGATGSAVGRENVLFTVADLSTVWAYFPLYPQFASRVRAGQAVRIRSQGEDPLEAESQVSYVGPLLEQDTRISYARAILDNTSRRWTPGLYVTASVTVERVHAAVAVPEEAIVRTPAGPAVFVADGDVFEMQPVQTGRTDGEWTEIVAGLRAGDHYVTRNAFLLKAELGKSEAGHEH